MTEVNRLNKAIAMSGYCSRRKADALIFGGKVTVNGVCEKDPSRRVHSTDVLAVDGCALSSSTPRSIYLMLHKPPQTVSTAHDPEGRETVLSLLPPEFQSYRLYPVGRLDYFSEGLLLLTNDGAFAYTLTHPRFHVPKVYEVLVRGTVSGEALDEMRSGITLDDGKFLPAVRVRATRIRENTLLTMTLFQGLNRQIRIMCASLRLTILKLVRVAQGPLLLGDLPQGSVRALTSEELQALRRACSDTLKTETHRGENAERQKRRVTELDQTIRQRRSERAKRENAQRKRKTQSASGAHSPEASRRK